MVFWRMLANRSLRIDEVRPTDLKCDPRNPRKHSNAQIGQIARSISTFGFAVPVLIDDTNQVIAGHGRVLAARDLGLERIPAIRLSHLTRLQARAFAIADNRLTERSTWDDHLLADTLKELSSAQLDFSLEVTGFSVGEIDFRIGGGTAEKPPAQDEADDLSEIASSKAVSRTGDVWLLGSHRVLLRRFDSPLHP